MNGGKGMGIENKNDVLSKAVSEVEASKGYMRLQKLFDDATFTQVDAFAKSEGGYAEAVAGYGYINGTGVYAIAQNSDLSGGAMSQAQAAKIKKVYDLAQKTGVPVITIYDSIGGRLAEGSQLLTAYGEILKMSSALSGVIPQISVVLGPCLGTQALIAACGDVVIAAKGAEFSLDVNTGSTAEKAFENGTAHLLAEDEEDAIAIARDVASMLPANNIETAAGFEFADASENVADNTPANDIPELVADDGSYLELSAAYGDDAVTALATLTGITVGFVSAGAKILSGDACKKIARFVRFCDAFSIPVITFVDSEKFCCLKSAARVSSAYAEATTAKISVITGEAYGALYVALAGTGSNADITFAYPNASVSPLNPYASAVIMLGDEIGKELKGSANPQADKEALVAKFKAENCSVFEAAANGYVEDVITPSATRAKLASALDMLIGKRVQRLPKKHNNLFI
jgi:acetyl-CoA carboxylase carboxyltransferase component